MGVCRRCEVAGIDGEIVRVHWFSRDAALLVGGGVVFLVCGSGGVWTPTILSLGPHRVGAYESLLGHVGLCVDGRGRFFNVVVGTCWLRFWFLLVGLTSKRGEDPFHEGFLAKFIREEAECKKSD